MTHQAVQPHTKIASLGAMLYAKFAFYDEA